MKEHPDLQRVNRVHIKVNQLISLGLGRVWCKWWTQRWMHVTGSNKTKLPSFSLLPFRPDWNIETWHILESAWLGNNNWNERERGQNQKVGRKSEPCFCFEQRMCVHLRQRMWAHLRQSSRANWQEIKNCRQNLTFGFTRHPKYNVGIIQILLGLQDLWIKNQEKFVPWNPYVWSEQSMWVNPGKRRLARC